MRISITQTVLSENEAATLSPAEFQSNPNTPPPPTYVLINFPSLTRTPPQKVIE